MGEDLAPRAVVPERAGHGRHTAAVDVIDAREHAIIVGANHLEGYLITVGFAADHDGADAQPGLRHHLVRVHAVGDLSQKVRRGERFGRIGGGNHVLATGHVPWCAHGGEKREQGLDPGIETGVGVRVVRHHVTIDSFARVLDDGASRDPWLDARAWAERGRLQIRHEISWP